MPIIEKSNPVLQLDAKYSIVSVSDGGKKGYLVFTAHSKDPSSMFAFTLYPEQIDELHRFLGAFLEEIERAKESK